MQHVRERRAELVEGIRGGLGGTGVGQAVAVYAAGVIIEVEDALLQFGER